MIAVLGVTRAHHTPGLTTGDADEAAMKRTLGSRAADTYVLASDEKISTASPFQVLPLEHVTALVVDRETDPSALDRLRMAGATLIEAP